jgi:hypothetical protein
LCKLARPVRNLKINLPPPPFIRNAVILELDLSRIPVDPGKVNNTTRPPVNLDARVTGYPLIIESVKAENNFVTINFGI